MRLTEEQRAGILTEGAEWHGAELGHVRIGDLIRGQFLCDVDEDGVMRALRIVAILDGIPEHDASWIARRLIRDADALDGVFDEGHASPPPSMRAIARALEEASR